ncbi:hypothetical protein ACIQNU_21330 [Streptomyces sp. NPDC091292]|uniref:hypothetical protein n=1 Tax=Streptomyces sp. NPDC091292 TaxID=3365991 RepID=UPI003829C036
MSRRKAVYQRRRRGRSASVAGRGVPGGAAAGHAREFRGGGVVREPRDEGIHRFLRHRTEQQPVRGRPRARPRDGAVVPGQHPEHRRLVPVRLESAAAQSVRDAEQHGVEGGGGAQVRARVVEETVEVAGEAPTGRGALVRHGRSVAAATPELSM